MTESSRTVLYFDGNNLWPWPGKGLALAYRCLGFDVESDIHYQYLDRMKKDVSKPLR